MSAFWSQFRRVTSASLLTCWLWLSMGAAFTHVCGQQGDSHGATVRSDIVCVSCLWTAVEKSNAVEEAPASTALPLLTRVFTDAPEAHPFIPSIVLPGRAPPA
jgi:hypothetical protein